jgi:hypothetical protein
MNSPPSDRLLLSLVLVAAVLLAAGAFLLAAQPTDLSGPRYQDFPIAPVVLVFFAWALLSVTARLLFIGRLPKSQKPSWAAMMWGGSRFAMAISTLILLICWLVSLAVGLQAEATFLHAAVLLLVFMGLTGVVGGAYLNSLLVLRRWRSGRTE